MTTTQQTLFTVPEVAPKNSGSSLSKPAAVTKAPFQYCAKEYKLVTMREMPMRQPLLDNPQSTADYHLEHVQSSPNYSPDVENFVVVLLNVRLKVIGHHICSVGTLDSCLVHPREVFRAAIVANASAVLLMHNHPSGDSSPSEADIKVTRDLIRAGQLMKIDVKDHIVVGRKTEGNPQGFHSLRELGYFYA